MGIRKITCCFVILCSFLSCCSITEHTPVIESSVMTNTVTTTPGLSVSPTPSPTPVPSPVPTPIPEPARATILAAGDVIMHDNVIRSGRNNEGNYSYNYIFDRIKPFVEKADFAVVSFEGVALETDRNYTGYPLFNAPPAIISAFSYAGFDMVNTGNNHCLDRGLKGLLETRDIIRRNNMQVIGTYSDASEPRHIIQDINGIKIGFLSYTYSCNMNENRLTDEEKKIHLSLIDKNKIKSEIETLLPLVDLTVVFMHWGVEYRVEPTEEQKKLAEFMFQAGADIILGSHPHVIEQSEIHETEDGIKYVIYSMGNFLSNQIPGSKPNIRNNDLTRESVMVSIVIEKDPVSEKTRIISVKHIPAWVYRYTENNIYKYSIIPIPSPDGEIFAEADDRLSEKLISSYKRTMEKMQDYP